MTAHTDIASAPRRANRLAREKSPYLLQHAHNPVDWFAWGAEAFEKAARENKPVFLSIGYSTCHWCHVMERESFEDTAVAAFLNEHFVSVKMDREERPDLDKVYMMFVQATTGQGGWPMTVFLTPDRKPFFGGTYFPPEDRQGRPGLLRLLRQIQQLWDTRQKDLAESAADIRSRLREASVIHSSLSGDALTGDALRVAGLLLKQAYDPANGGFGGAPKFPQPAQPQFLLRYAARFGDGEAVRMVLNMCDRMAAGGIRDQLGGGFARYSIDAQWRVPHFEKMLYDNAQLAQLYLDAHRVSFKPGGSGPADASQPHAEVACGILDYVLRDMTHPDGGFYSAEDADSEGHEGKFYCWTRAELQTLLTPDEFDTAASHFGITEQGNFIDHSHPQPLAGQNVLSIVNPVASDRLALLASAKRKLLDARSRRVRPHLDDKVLVSWNGLMLGAMARASAVLGEERYRTAAERNLVFLQNHLWQPAPGRLEGARTREGKPPVTGALFHRWRDGERDSVQLLEDYAFLLLGVIDLYEATLEPKHLDFAVALAESLLERFYDAEEGGFWQTLADETDLVFRVKDAYDGAEPCGNSVAALSLLKVGAITGREEFAEAARKTLRLFADRLQQSPLALPCLLQALDFSLQEPRRVVLAGDPRSSKARALLQAIHSVPEPNKVVLGNAGAVDSFARTLPAKNGPVVYVCTGTSCQAPTSDAEKAAELLR